jgi:hypothetical protein
MKKEKSFGKEVLIGTVATVLGGIILAMIPSARDFFASLFSLVGGFFSSLGQYFISLWGFLRSPSEVPMGIILLLALLSLPTIVIPFWALISSKTTGRIQSSNEPNLYEYKEDIIFDVLWRWDRIPPPTPDSISGFCPTCGTRLICKPLYVYAYTKFDSIFFCETCNKDIARLEGTLDYALRTVSRQIERKVNTGEWKWVVETQKKPVE